MTTCWPCSADNGVWPSSVSPACKREPSRCAVRGYLSSGTDEREERGNTLFSRCKSGRTDNVRERSWKRDRLGGRSGPCLVSEGTQLGARHDQRVVLSASEGGDGESGHLALQGIEGSVG